MVASEPFRFPGLSPENTDLCTVEASVTTGFESVAEEECKKRFGTNITRTRGRIGFDFEVEKIKEVLTLKCIDNVSVLIGEVENMEFKETKEECLQQIKDVFSLLDWKKGLKVWEKMTGFDISSMKEASELKYRVTCTRVGKNHKFQSQEASAAMGAIINDSLGWKVDLTKFDLNFLLNICDNYVYAGLMIVKESLHKRNLVYFGPATLRPTISHCMLRLGYIEPGDVVCDPACGSGSIIVEGILSWPHAIFVCGDIHDVAYARTKQNVDAVTNKKSAPVDVFQWDATRLPMLDDSIDVLVTNLPFGKKMGNKQINRTLYPQLMDEFVRTVKTVTGRAIILTADRKTMINVLKCQQKYWKVTRQSEVNIGGLNGVCYVLKRTNVEFQRQENK